MRESRSLGLLDQYRETPPSWWDTVHSSFELLLSFHVPSVPISVERSINVDEYLESEKYSMVNAEKCVIIQMTSQLVQ